MFLCIARMFPNHYLRLHSMFYSKVVYQRAFKDLFKLIIWAISKYKLWSISMLNNHVGKLFPPNLPVTTHINWERTQINITRDDYNHCLHRWGCAHHFHFALGHGVDDWSAAGLRWCMTPGFSIHSRHTLPAQRPHKPVTCSYKDVIISRNMNSVL